MFSKAKDVLVLYIAKNQGEYVLPNGVKDIGSYAFANCTGLTSITIPDGITDIGSYVFQYFTGLTSIITIPDGVTSIGECAFRGCAGLTSVTILATTPPILQGGNFTADNDILFVPANCVDAYKATSWNNAFTTITEIK